MFYHKIVYNIMLLSTLGSRIWPTRCILNSAQLPGQFASNPVQPDSASSHSVCTAATRWKLHSEACLYASQAAPNVLLPWTMVALVVRPSLRSSSLESGGWKCAIVGVPWRGSVSACLAWGESQHFSIYIYIYRLYLVILISITINMIITININNHNHHNNNITYY